MANLEYTKYLKSKQFKEVKKIVLDRDNHRCQFCGRSEDEAKLTVHHRCYEHLYQGGEAEANDCITICQLEHIALHKIKGNYKWFSITNPRNDNSKDA